MTTKRKPISARQRRENARKAAMARWGGKATSGTGWNPGTICKAEETGDGRTVACAPCSLSWAMDSLNYPRCPRLANIKALPPVSDLEQRARAIVHALCHGGHRADFDDALVNRPDWQAHVDFIVGELVKTCAEVT